MVSVCLSHKEDPDGIVSATLIKSVYSHDTDADADMKVILVDYSDFLQRLEEAVNMEGLEQLFICDMGLSKANQEVFFRLVEHATRRGSRVTYIDHHHLEEGSKDRLRGYGVELIHSVEECTSILIYHNLLSRKLSRFALLAGLAAIIDEMDDRDVASRILGSYDKHFVEFEATALAYAIYQNQHNQDFLLRLVDKLVEAMPHAIDGVLESAKEYAEKIISNIGIIENDARREGDVVYIQAVNLPASTVANMLLTMYKGIKVAISYKQRGDKMVVSLRGSDLCTLHLGRVVNDIASELGGSGGGHDKASGAMIPKDSIGIFIEKIKGLVNGSSS